MGLSDEKTVLEIGNRLTHSHSNQICQPLVVRYDGKETEKKCTT